jgi:hypothetical protein
MANILLGEQNKELLWSILYSNKTFETIPQSKFNNVKTIFENAIIKVVNSNLEMLESTTNIKAVVTQLNKVILQNIIVDIANFNQLLLTSTNPKTNFKTASLETFEKQYKEKQVSFNEFMTKIEPPQVNFEAIKEDTLETSELDKLLENIQKERLKDIKTPIQELVIKKPEKSEKSEKSEMLEMLEMLDKSEKLDKPEKPINIELVNLNDFEKELFTETPIQDPPISKKKIVTIEDLLHTIQPVPEKKDTQSLLLSIDEKLITLMTNQQKIMDKLGLL